MNYSNHSKYLAFSRNALIVLSIVLLAGCTSPSPTGVGSIRIEPPNTAVQPGQASQLVVVGPGGETITEGITWVSSDPAKARISSTGLVTGGYGTGSAMITATTSSASAEAAVEIVRMCAAPAPFTGSPNPSNEIQDFAVSFDPGTDSAKRANDLATRFGFELIEVTSDGFTASLTPRQASDVACAANVASLAYA